MFLHVVVENNQRWRIILVCGEGMRLNLVLSIRYIVLTVEQKEIDCKENAISTLM